ncbi:hypothetical protein ACS0TY_032145 [Phlomoides rotata]
MAACIDNSTIHNIYTTANSPCSSSTRLCKSSSSLLIAKCLKDSSKISPQECSDQIWLKIREESESGIIQEPILSNFYHSAILSHTSLESALSNLLSIKLCNTDVSLSSDALNAVFVKALIEDGEIQRSIRDDLRAVKDRDPACLSYTHCFLNFKGFLAIQAHRLGHKFWLQGRIQLAILIQNRVSQVFAVDIHPGATIGSGVVFDHGTGIVVGETAVIGKGVTVLHNVTLGGTGKGGGDRHPKIGDGVMIGAGVKVLGNIKVGENAKIGAGSVVLKDIPAGATAVGNPARLVGRR